MIISDKEMQELKLAFPGSTFVQVDNKVHIKLFVDHIYSDFRVNEVFELEVQIPSTYPRAIADVIEVGGTVNPSYPHRYTDGQLCLATDSEIIYKCGGIVTLKCLIDSFIIPYLFSYRYYERYDDYPFGERSHGARGILEAWIDIFSVKTEEEAVDIVMYAVRQPYRGHLPCFCNSGKKRRNCHPIGRELLIKLEDNTLRNSILREMEIIINEVNYYKHNKRKAK